MVTVLHFIITHIYFFPSPDSDKHGHELALATVADPENFGGGDNKKFKHKTSKIRMSSPKLRLIFRPKSEIQTFFPPKTKWSPKKKKKKKKKKKVLFFRKFKRFFRPKSGGLQKKKRSSPKLRLIFRPKSLGLGWWGGCIPPSLPPNPPLISNSKMFAS